MARALIVNVDNTAPKLAITRSGPARFRVGDTLRLRFRATDAETGRIGARNIVWRVILHHSKHQHLFRSRRSGALDLRVPDHGDDSYFEVRVQVGDGDGAVTRRSLRLRPLTVPVRLAANLPGVRGALDGAGVSFPSAARSIVGGRHVAAAPLSLTRSGRR